MGGGEAIRRGDVRGSCPLNIRGWTAEPHAPRFRGLEGGLGAGGDHLPLMLRDGRQDVQGEAGCLGHVYGEEVHTALHEVRNEGDVARETVESGNQEHRPFPPAEIEGAAEFRPIIPPAALYLRHFGRQFAADPREVPGDGRRLSL